MNSGIVWFAAIAENWEMLAAGGAVRGRSCLMVVAAVKQRPALFMMEEAVVLS